MPSEVAMPKIGAQHRGQIHALAERSVNAPSEQGIQRRAHAQRKIHPIGKALQRDAHQRIHAPAADTVVKQRPYGGLPRGLHGLARADRRRQVLGHRFCHGKEHEIGADPGCEQRRGPGEQAEIGFGIGRPQLHATKTRRREIYDETQKHGRDQDIKPTEPARYLPHQHADGVARPARRHNGLHGKQHDPDRGAENYRRVQATAVL